MVELEDTIFLFIVISFLGQYGGLDTITSYFLFFNLSQEANMSMVKNETLPPSLLLLSIAIFITSSSKSHASALHPVSLVILIATQPLPVHKSKIVLSWVRDALFTTCRTRVSVVSLGVVFVGVQYVLA